MTKLEGGLVTRLVEEEEVARHHRQLAAKEKGDRTFHYRGEGILTAGRGKKKQRKRKLTQYLPEIYPTNTMTDELVPSLISKLQNQHKCYQVLYMQLQ